MNKKIIKVGSAAVLASMALSLTSNLIVDVNATERVLEMSEEAMTQEKIDAANNAYNNVKTNLNFITMSDTEFGVKPEDVNDSQQVNYESNNWAYKRIADWAKDKSFNVNGIMVNGDVVGANEAEYYDHLKGEDRLVQGWYRAIEQVFTENFGEEVYMMFSNGNHDIADLLGKTFDENHKDDDKWYYGDSSTGYVSNFHTKINGYDFITLDYNGKFHFGYTNQKNGYQTFLRDTLEEITSDENYDSKKPIFVQAHSGYAGTSLGGNWAVDYDMMGQDLQEILKDYPQVLIASAHTHFSVGGEFAIYQDDFTFFENQSMNYMYMDVPSNFVEGGYFDSNTGNEQYTSKTCNFISVLEDGTTVIRRYDVTNNKWIGMPWTVDTTKGKDGFKYTDENRSKISPWFGGDASITATNVTETSLTLGFDQGFDDEQVNNYSVKITDASTGEPVSISVRQLPDKSNKEGKIFNLGEFRAYSRYYYEPNIMSFEIKNLEPGQTYNVEIYAYDDFENKSVEPLVGTIKTQGEVNLPDIDGPVELPEDIEENKIFNMNFEENLTDDIGKSDAIANGEISYVDSYHNNKGFAVEVKQGNKNYIDLGNREEWNLGTDKNLTVNFWVKVNNQSGYSSILSNKSWSSFSKEGINFAPRSSDTSTLELSLGDGKNGQYVFANVGDYTGAWHMMSLTINRDDQTANIYLDGDKVNTASIASVGDMTSGNNMYLGIDASKSYGTIGFYMDDLQMWSSSLDDNDIKALYNVDNYSTNEKLLEKAISFAESTQDQINNEIANGRVYDEELLERFNKILYEAKELQDYDKYLVYYNELKDIISEINNSAINYKVEATAENGTITPEIAVVGVGNSVVFELNPNEGYKVDESKIEVTPESEYVLDGSELILNNIKQGTSVSVSFIKEHTIEKVRIQAIAENGSITPSVLEIDAGQDVFFKLEANEGYTIEGAEVIVTPNIAFEFKDDSIVIKNAMEDLNVKVVFAKEKDITTDEDDDSNDNSGNNGGIGSGSGNNGSGNNGGTNSGTGSNGGNSGTSNGSGNKLPQTGGANSLLTMALGALTAIGGALSMKKKK